MTRSALPLPIQYAGAEPSGEPISPAVLRGALEAMKAVASLPINATPEQRGSAIGKCMGTAPWLESELRRVGLA